MIMLLSRFSLLLFFILQECCSLYFSEAHGYLVTSNVVERSARWDGDLPRPHTSTWYFTRSPTGVG